jgi:hypothetical protein
MDRDVRRLGYRTAAPVLALAAALFLFVLFSDG